MKLLAAEDTEYGVRYVETLEEDDEGVHVEFTTNIHDAKRFYGSLQVRQAIIAEGWRVVEYQELKTRMNDDLPY